MDKFVNRARYRRQEKLNRKRKLFIKKLSFFVLFILILSLTFYLGNTFINKKDTNNIPIETAKTDEGSTASPKTVTLTVVGDIMCHSTQFKVAYDSTSKSYDFSYVFDDVKDYLNKADLTIGNLETTFAGEKVGFSGYPTFNTPKELATALKDVGFDVITTANNHSLDKGFKGLSSTIDELDNVGLSHTGTAKTKEEQDAILIKEVNGLKIGFISYTYGTNGIPVPSGKEFCVNLIDKENIKKEIQKLKLKGADVICASMHWGNEYKLAQNSTQEDLADFLFENGVDIIFGSHPHVLEPMEKKIYKMPDGTEKEVFVIYSLGNFISGQTYANTDTSIMLNLTITKNPDGKLSIDNINYIPLYMLSKPADNSKRYRILATEDAINDYKQNNTTAINSAIYAKLEKSLGTVNKILGKNNI